MTIASGCGPADPSRRGLECVLIVPSLEQLRMLGDEIAVERNADVEHMLVEGGEALALRLRAVAEEGEILKGQVFLLLEQQGEPQPDPQGRDRVERLHVEVHGVDDEAAARRRDDEITKADRIGQQQVLAGLRTLDPQLRDMVLRLGTEGPQAVGAGRRTTANGSSISRLPRLPSGAKPWHQHLRRA